ncbi:hypothetical protein C8C99_0330 [Acidovorax sp. 107]|nr:hypothetical protein C8C99_0330 [Acidovorax sp. 107]
MITFSQAFSAAAGGGYMVRAVRPLPLSSVVVSPVAGLMVYMMIAPGASGGFIDSAASAQRLATGGGAGEIVFDVVSVGVNDSFTFTHGAPGVGVGSVNATVNGNDATNSSVTGPNSYSCTAVGGKKGLAASSVASLAGGAGGTGGTGGSAKVLRFPGARGGNISAAAGAARIATGGGAANPQGFANSTTTRGGDCSSATSATNSATGGGGVGGNGGDVTTGSVLTGGGGSGAAAPNNATTGGGNIKGTATTASPADILSLLAVYGIDYFGGGSASGSSPQASGPGGGVGAGSTMGNSVLAGNFGGTGGTLGGSSGAALPGFGAGSGGNSAPGTTGGATASGGLPYAVVIFLEKVA